MKSTWFLGNRKEVAAESTRPNIRISAQLTSAQARCWRLFYASKINLKKGEGVNKDETKGFQFIRKATAGGDSYAMHVLADFYREGVGIDINKSKAISLYQRTVKGGNWNCHLPLREIYRDGKGVNVNIGKAIGHFEVYANHNK